MSLLRSKPSAILRGLEKLVAVTSDCTSKRIVRLPSRDAETAVPGAVDPEVLRNRLCRSLTSSSPAEVIRNSPISFTEP